MKTLNELYDIFISSAKKSEVENRIAFGFKNFPMPLEDTEESKRKQINYIKNFCLHNCGGSSFLDPNLEPVLANAFGVLPENINPLTGVFEREINSISLVRAFCILACDAVLYPDKHEAIKDAVINILRESENYAMLPVVYTEMIIPIHIIAEVTEEENFEGIALCNYFTSIIKNRYRLVEKGNPHAYSDRLFQRSYSTFLKPYFEDEVIKDLMMELIQEFPSLDQNSNIVDYCKSKNIYPYAV